MSSTMLPEALGRSFLGVATTFFHQETGEALVLVLVGALSTAHMLVALLAAEMKP